MKVRVKYLHTLTHFQYNNVERCWIYFWNINRSQLFSERILAQTLVPPLTKH
jgi:hypothetical protein